MFALPPGDIVLQKQFLFSKKIIHPNTLKEPRLFLYSFSITVLHGCLNVHYRLSSDGDKCGQQTQTCTDRMHRVITKYTLCLWGQGISTCYDI